MIRDDEKYQNDVQLSIKRIKTDFHSKTNNHDGDPKSVFEKHLDQIIWTVLLITEVPKDHEYINGSAILTFTKCMIQY